MADKKNKENEKTENSCGCSENDCVNGNCTCEPDCECGCDCECSSEKADTEKNINAKKEKQGQSEKELADAKDKFLRLAADFDNFKKRSRTEKEATYNNAVADTAAVILPILDSLEYALKTETTDVQYKQGVEKILTQAIKCFSDLNINSIGEPGEIFNPEYHNAVAHFEDDSLDTGVVAEVLQKGYKLGDKVIRHALVKVAN